MQQGRITGTEIVEGQRASDSAQLCADRSRGGQVFQQRVLGDLQNQLRRADGVPAEYGGNPGRKIQVDDELRRYVDACLEASIAVQLGPGGQLGAGLLQHGIGQVGQQAGAAGQGHELNR